jgi:GDPmannose 4,6-dehydratase
MSKVALITGITGQDGSYLAELLLKKGYEVHGLVRRLSTPNLINIQNIMNSIHLVEGDLMDQGSLDTAVRKIKPDELYNLGAQSFVGTSWTQPILTHEITGLGAVRVFEAVRNNCPDAKVYQASSSEQFGSSPAPQNEDTPFRPRSPYACAKTFAHLCARNYRESYGMFISCGICFNHESPRRGIEFVTRKITDGVAKIKLGKAEYIELGYMDARRDWGFAPDVCNAIWHIMQLDKPEDFVIATGQTHTVRQFVVKALECAGLEPYIEKYVRINIKYIRPAEVNDLKGDYSKANKTFSWSPKVKFDKLVKIMVDNDIDLNRSL